MNTKFFFLQVDCFWLTYWIDYQTYLLIYWPSYQTYLLAQIACMSMSMCLKQKSWSSTQNATLPIFLCAYRFYLLAMHSVPEIVVTTSLAHFLPYFPTQLSKPYHWFSVEASLPLKIFLHSDDLAYTPLMCSQQIKLATVLVFNREHVCTSHVFLTVTAMTTNISLHILSMPKNIFWISLHIPNLPNIHRQKCFFIFELQFTLLWYWICF